MSGLDIYAILATLLTIGLGVLAAAYHSEYSDLKKLARDLINALSDEKVTSDEIRLIINDIKAFHIYK